METIGYPFEDLKHTRICTYKMYGKWQGGVAKKLLTCNICNISSNFMTFSCYYIKKYVIYVNYIKNISKFTCYARNFTFGIREKVWTSIRFCTHKYRDVHNMDPYEERMACRYF